MKTTNRTLRLFVTATIIGSGLLVSTFAKAESGSTVTNSSSAEENILTPVSGTGINILPGQGNIVIEQKNGSGAATIGKWELILPNNQQKDSGEPETSITNTMAGMYTIFAKTPTSATAVVRVYKNGTLEKVVQRPQTSFTLQNNDSARIVIHYTITRTGLVAVDSDPLGMTFTLKGPNNTVVTGTTPASYPGVAEGQYQVIYDNIKGCNVPASKSLRLEAGSRVSFSMYISCPMADKMRERQAEETNGNGEYVMVGTIGSQTAARDVPQDAWFAPYIVNVAKYGILSGYKDEKGNSTGVFGPSNDVTVAELAKVAHKIAGISSDAFNNKDPQNARAQQAWFSPFIASAESRGWVIFNDAGINPTRPATRGEVLVTLLQALDKPLAWQKGTLFTDVTARTLYAGAIETAATAKVVEGRKDDKGNDLRLFGPTDAINRAELAKILSRMIDVYKVGGSSSSAASRSTK